MRSVQSIIAPPPHHFVGDGFRVHNFIPSAPPLVMHRMDPFIMLDYNSPFHFAPSDLPRGVGVHPHRGFETVTIAYQGAVEHGDSRGNSGVIYSGDVQWMTAGSGILHKEYHEQNFSKTGGIFQMVQLWVNLPAKFKMTDPKYQSLTSENIPKVILDNGKAEIIAGNFNGIKGLATTFSPIEIWNITLNKSGKEILKTDELFNTSILVIEGQVRINNEHLVSQNEFVLFENRGTDIHVETIDDTTKLLFLSGQPLGEPIASHGPFVMNTKEEIYEAIQDYQSGKFGYLKD